MAVYGSSTAGGGSNGTGDRTVAFTPAVGDLLVVGVLVCANTNNTPTMSDDQGGTYTLIQNQTCDMTAADGDRLSVFVRNQMVASAVSHTITAATGSNTAGEIVPVAVKRMTKVGSAAVRSSGKAEGITGVAPAAALSQSALTTNLTLFFCGSADTTTTPPTSWNEAQDASQASPTTALEAAYRDTGFTGTTITAAATQTGAWGCIVLELDGLQEGGGGDTIASTADSVSTAGTVYERVLADTINTSDSVSGGLDEAVTVSDSVSASDSAEPSTTYARAPAGDTVAAVTDSAARTGTSYSREVSDTPTLSDSVVGPLLWFERADSDTCDLADTHVADFTEGAGAQEYNYTLEDSVDVADARSTTGTVYERTWPDTIDAETDSVIRAAQSDRAGDDTVTSGDTSAHEVLAGRNFADSVTLAETPTTGAEYVRAFVDALDLDETIEIGLTLGAPPPSTYPIWQLPDPLAVSVPQLTLSLDVPDLSLEMAALGNAVGPLVVATIDVLTLDVSAPSIVLALYEDPMD